MVLRLLFTVITFLLVSACGLADNVLRDCAWVGVPKAWVDANQDGNWNETEQPLENVTFFVDETRRGYINVGDTAVSNSEGEAKYLVWLSGCPKVKFEAYAIAPANYLFTTESRLPADMSKNNETFLFGFIYDPDAPTATTAPEVSMQCVKYQLFDNIFNFASSTDMAIGPEGEVWVATNQDQVTWFSADGEERRDYTSLDGIPSNVVRTIEITPNGEVWLGTNEGIVRFDGAEWVQYSSAGKSAITDISIDDIVVTPDGEFLLSRSWTWKGVIRYDPTTGSTESEIFSDYIEGVDYWIGAIHYSYGGSLWLFSENAIY